MYGICWKRLLYKLFSICQVQRIRNKAPLCKGGCQPKADWGIVKERKSQSLYPLQCRFGGMGVYFIS